GAGVGGRADVVQREYALAGMTNDDLATAADQRAHASQRKLGELQYRFELRHGGAYRTISVWKIDTACPLIQTPARSLPVNSSSTSTRPGRCSEWPWTPEKRARSPLRARSPSRAR